jgi:hypothetical protein
MRKWLLEETGEIRKPKKDELYLENVLTDHIAIAQGDFRFEVVPILRVTEIVPGGYIDIPESWFTFNHPLSDRFDEWNY